MNGFVDLTDIVLTWQGLPRDQDPFVLTAEQTQDWKWSWYQSSPALSHSVNALLHASWPAKSGICYRERENSYIAAALFLYSVFIGGSCSWLFVTQSPYSKERNCPNLNCFIYQQGGCLCSCYTRTGCSLSTAESRRPVIACEPCWHHPAPTGQPNTPRDRRTPLTEWMCSTRLIKRNICLSCLILWID